MKDIIKTITTKTFTLDELNELSALLEKKKSEVNPYANLKSMSNKEFGESFSENLLCEKVKGLSHNNGAGHDLHSDKLGELEVKSVRLPVKSGWTMNQVHPQDCDGFLFAFYDTVKGTEKFCYVPSDEILSNFSCCRQHTREDGNPSCWSIHSSKKNEATLEKYYVGSFKELCEIV